MGRFIYESDCIGLWIYVPVDAESPLREVTQNTCLTIIKTILTLALVVAGQERKRNTLVDFARNAMTEK